jgi:rubrerythrin
VISTAEPAYQEGTTMSDSKSDSKSSGSQSSGSKGGGTQACTTCATWTCGRCGSVQVNVSPQDTHSCPACGYDQGSLQATQHSQKIWGEHNPGLNWNEAAAH